MPIEFLLTPDQKCRIAEHANAQARAKGSPRRLTVMDVERMLHALEQLDLNE